MHNLIWAEISRSALRNNISLFRKLVGKNTLIAPCVKANAYGHGLEGCAYETDQAGADWFCVNSAWEAGRIRKRGIKKPVLILGHIGPSDFEAALEAEARSLIYDRAAASRLDQVAGRLGCKAKVHIKLDTGMSRQGVLERDFDAFHEYLKTLDHIEIEGVATHFASSDEPADNGHYAAQYRIFKEVHERVSRGHEYIFHCANSAAALLYRDAHFDMIRPGISVYGYYPSPDVGEICRAQGLLLEPALALKTVVAAVKDLPAGSKVSYSGTYTAENDLRIAVLPIGYYDGLDRKLSNRGEVLMGGRRSKILGRVCMNITIADASAAPDVQAGDEVVIIGSQDSETVAVEELAARIGTINYEVTTRLRESMPRVFV